MFAVALALPALASPLAAQPKPYTIPVILSLTGVGANLGRDDQTALTAFEKYINRTGGIKGAPLHFQIYDDQTQPAVAVQLFQQILQTKPAVVLGSTLAGPTQAIAALAVNGPVLYALTPNMLPTPRGYVFSSSALIRDLIGVNVPYFRGRGWLRVGTIVTNDASGQNNEDGFEAALALQGPNGPVRIVDKEIVATTDVTINAQAAKMKAAGVDVVVALQNGTQFGTVLHGLADVGLAVPVFTSAGNFSPELLETYKTILPKEMLASGTSFFNRDRAASDPLKKPIDDFYAALASEGVTVPVTTHALAWDPALIVVSALRALGTDATPGQIRDWIEKLRNFPGVQGMYDFSEGNQHGLSTSGLLVLRSDPQRPGKAVIVSKQGGAPL